MTRPRPTVIAGRRVLFVMAVEAEYGARLRELFAPLFTGVGPVEAAVATAGCLADLDMSGERPDLLVSLGSAGSRSLPQAEIFQVSAVSYRDMDASALGFPKGLTPFLDLPAVLRLSCPFADVPGATLATGASVVSGAAYEGVDAEMMDMETFAVVRAAMRFGVPAIGLRGVSDGDAELRRINDWTRYLGILDEKLAGVVARLHAIDWDRLTA